jgi:Protein of unknown function (DUF429)
VVERVGSLSEPRERLLRELPPCPAGRAGVAGRQADAAIRISACSGTTPWLRRFPVYARAGTIIGMRVLGVDACTTGWIGIELDRGRFVVAYLADRLTTLLAAVNDIQGIHAVGIDMPLGLVETGPEGFTWSYLTRWFHRPLCFRSSTRAAAGSVPSSTCPDRCGLFQQPLV